MTKRCCIQSANVQSSVFHRSRALSAPGSTTAFWNWRHLCDVSRFWCGRIRPTPQAKANPPSARSTAWCRPHEICCTSQTSSNKSLEKDLHASLDSPPPSGSEPGDADAAEPAIKVSDYEMLDFCCLASLAVLPFSQAPNKRPCQFKRFRRANKIAASMARPWQMAGVLKWSRFIPMHSLGGSKQ